MVLTQRHASIYLSAKKNTITASHTPHTEMIDPTGWISIVGSVIAIIGLVFVYIFVRKIHQYRHTFSFLQSFRSNSQDNLNTTSTILYREELLDSYTEQALWTCSLCQFQNHPDRKCCDLCQTARGLDIFKTWKWFQSKKKLRKV